MSTLVFLSYVALSLVIGGGAVMMDVWTPPTMLDRARGKFASLKMHGTELVMFAVFVALIWPIVAVVAIADRIGSMKGRS